MKTTLIIIDDHHLVRDGIKSILDFEPNFEVLAVGSDGREALPLYEKYKPDIVLMDVNMPIMNGIDATKTLLSKYPDVKVVILSVHQDESYVKHTLKAGAVGYLLKDMGGQSLVDALKGIAEENGAFLHPRVTNFLLNEYRNLLSNQNKKRRVQMPLHILTKRECDVLQMMSYGKSNREIAKSLNISDKTVKNHVSNVLQKLNVIDRTQAVLCAINNGWVDYSFSEQNNTQW